MKTGLQLSHAYRKMSVSFRKADLDATGLLPPQQHMEPVYTSCIYGHGAPVVAMAHQHGGVVPLMQLIAGVHWHIVVLGILVCACRIECPAAHIAHLLSQSGACFGSIRAGPYPLSDPPKKHYGILCKQQLTDLWLAAFQKLQTEPGPSFNRLFSKWRRWNIKCSKLVSLNMKNGSKQHANRSKYV